MAFKEGWFNDPSGSGLMRFWDGKKWTPNLINPKTLEKFVDDNFNELNQSNNSKKENKVFSESNNSKPKRAMPSNNDVANGKEVETIKATSKNSFSFSEMFNSYWQKMTGKQAAYLKELQLIEDRIEKAKNKEQIEKQKIESRINKTLQKEQAAKLSSQEYEAFINLQDAGIYELSHPLDDSMKYKERLSDLKAKKADMIRSKNACTAEVEWQIDGSKQAGKKMAADIAKLMLRAYNQEIDTLVRSMKPYKLEQSKEKANKAIETIERLGKTMKISISRDYHKLRIKELTYTADYIEVKEREKEKEKEERERLREEALAQREIEKRKLELEKEKAKKVQALDFLRKKIEEENRIAEIFTPIENNPEIVALMEEINKSDVAISDAENRAANLKAGFVYVISNVGSFGDKMIKIGMTRRQDPMDRVKELGDASVPFGFDVHLLHYSDDARGIEASLHNYFAQRRVNLINRRREHFYATPEEVRIAIGVLGLSGVIASFMENSEAAEFHQSEITRKTIATQPELQNLRNTPF